MSPLHAAAYRLDADRVGAAPDVASLVRRRFGGRFFLDPFGLDPQLCDVVAPWIGAAVRVDVEGAEHLPTSGPAVLIANRGLGLAEPAALSVAVRRAVGRRLRVVGAPDLRVAGGWFRRFGAIAGSAGDLGAALRAGHLVAVPLAPTWLRSGAGQPPLELLQAMLVAPVLPVAIRPDGPFGTPTSWSVTISEAVPVDPSYDLDDPLAAAELAEAVRARVDGLLGVAVDA